MEINIKELENNICIINIDGEIDIHTSSDLKDELMNHIDLGVKYIVMNLGQVSYIDSSGIGVFISTLATLKKLGGKILIINITEAVKKVFELTKLTNFFQIYENEQLALNELKKEIN